MRIEFRDGNTKVASFSCRAGKITALRGNAVLIEAPVARIDELLDVLAEARDARWHAPHVANQAALDQERATVAALRNQATKMQAEIDEHSKRSIVQDQRLKRAEAQVIKMQNWIDQILELKADRYGD